MLKASTPIIARQNAAVVRNAFGVHFIQFGVDKLNKPEAVESE